MIDFGANLEEAMHLQRVDSGGGTPGRRPKLSEDILPVCNGVIRP